MYIILFSPLQNNCIFIGYFLLFKSYILNNKIKIGEMKLLLYCFFINPTLNCQYSIRIAFDFLHYQYK